MLFNKATLLFFLAADAGSKRQTAQIQNLQSEITTKETENSELKDQVASGVRKMIQDQLAADTQTKILKEAHLKDQSKQCVNRLYDVSELNVNFEKAQNEIKNLEAENQAQNSKFIEDLSATTGAQEKWMLKCGQYYFDSLNQKEEISNLEKKNEEFFQKNKTLTEALSEAHREIVELQATLMENDKLILDLQNQPHTMKDLQHLNDDTNVSYSTEATDSASVSQNEDMERNAWETEEDVAWYRDHFRKQKERKEEERLAFIKQEEDEIAWHLARAQEKREREENERLAFLEEQKEEKAWHLARIQEKREREEKERLAFIEE